MPFADVPAFLVELRTKKGLSATALELTILSATRTTETLHAKRGEFDLDAATWTIPGVRMKMGVEHIVPLQPRAVELVRPLLLGLGSGDWVFPGYVPGKTLSQMAMLECLRGIKGCEGLTVHGFRSAFRDWAGDMTDHPREIAELCLAHSVGNDVEQAYRRSSALAKRRLLMAEWAAYLGGVAAPPAAEKLSAPSLANPGLANDASTGAISTVHYPAIIERAGTAFSVFFPDIEGLGSAGDTVEDAKRHAEIALRVHLAAMVRYGVLIPDPSELEAYECDPDVIEVVRILVSVEPPGRAATARGILSS